MDSKLPLASEPNYNATMHCCFRLSFTRAFTVLIIATTCHVAPLAFAQRQQPTPTILKGPADWRFERLPIPPGFAPDIKWTGFEEARFAPGMFVTTSSNYFTYALTVSVDGIAPIITADVKDFLDKYFKGLSTGVGRRKGLAPDASQLGAEVTAVKTDKELPARFTAKVPFFDTFNDGRKILLNMEITVLPRSTAKKNFVVLLISPQPTEAAVWKQLRAIATSVEKMEN